MSNFETIFNSKKRFIQRKYADSEMGSFGNPIDGNNNRMQSVESSGLELRYPLDTGKRNYSEQRQDANPLTLRSWYTGDDVNGPWPHTKNLSGPLDFEPTDNQNEDSTDPVMGSFQQRYSHMNGVNHPWPKTPKELSGHLISHHQKIINYVVDGASHDLGLNITPGDAEEVLHRTVNESHDSVDRFHKQLHMDPKLRKSRYFGNEDHEHDDDLGVEIPENIETIAPTYITSSWHQSFVDVFDTHPDEESPDTLLNPEDELKNGRPRANDLPNQSAQLLPGMLIDHDQMGGSGTSSAGF